ncbi:hypothetical protein [Salinibacter ruber]|uniref:hypothetical protein n=1 Tax=Salinibacter ruber TaxID=146919 RepID=UPI0020746892|nr:hypothetical protein [Salinibacter ruber]
MNSNDLEKEESSAWSSLEWEVILNIIITALQAVAYVAVSPSLWLVIITLQMIIHISQLLS